MTEERRRRSASLHSALGHLRAIALVGALMLVGCSGQQSALDPAGRGAEQIAELFWWLTAGAVIVWTVVIGLAIYFMRLNPEAHSERRSHLLIVAGGAVLPTLALTVILVYGLALLPDLMAPAPETSPRIAVSGEQWWWRVRYQTPEGEEIELANEIHLPVGEPVQFRLEAADVIHSFWIPSIGGKMDMFPGRTTYLSLMPTKTGIYRGACAEFCGTSHALMNFYVVVSEPDEYARWLAHQARPAEPPTEPLAIRGQEVFFANGCSSCHTIRGTPADGLVAPDLTHVGSRVSIGAGILPTEPDDFANWISATERVKPGVHMPTFRMLPPEDLRALVAYLNGLK